MADYYKEGVREFDESRGNNANSLKYADPKLMIKFVAIALLVLGWLTFTGKIPNYYFVGGIIGGIMLIGYISSSASDNRITAKQAKGIIKEELTRLIEENTREFGKNWRFVMTGYCNEVVTVGLEPYWEIGWKQIDLGKNIVTPHMAQVWSKSGRIKSLSEDTEGFVGQEPKKSIGVYQQRRPQVIHFPPQSYMVGDESGEGRPS